MKNFLFLTILLLLFSCKKEEQHFPRTTEELKSAIEETRLKKVESCDSEFAKMLCLGKWELDTLNYTAMPNQIIFECNGTYSLIEKDDFDSTEKIYAKNWYLKSDTLFLECYDPWQDKTIHFFHKYLIMEIDEKLNLQGFKNQNSHIHNCVITCGRLLNDYQPTLQWMLDSFHNSKYKKAE